MRLGAKHSVAMPIVLDSGGALSKLQMMHGGAYARLCGALCCFTCD